MTSLKDLKSRWTSDPEFRAEYAALEDEFALAAALIDARMGASMTQEQLAQAMVVIASLVSAPGLGVLVLRGIRNLELGVGLVAGLGIVLLAIILDRVTKASLARVNAAQKAGG